MYRNHCSKGWLFTLVHLKVICSSQDDIALSEFSSFCYTTVRERNFEPFQKECVHLDIFCVKETYICNYKILLSVLKLMLLLNHGQVAVESGFSVSNKVLNVNMHGIYITFCKLIINHMTSYSLLPQSFPSTKSLLKSVRCSWQRFQEFAREKESLQKQNQCNQVAIINKKIEEVKNYIAESIKISKTFTWIFWDFQMKLRKR